MNDDHRVHEAIGPPLSGPRAGACIGVGINSLLALGVLPVLLGALADEHRLSAAQIGQAAMVELMAMGMATASMGLIRRPAGLRAIGVAASLALAAVDLAGMEATGAGVLLARAAAGVLEGILLWIPVGMIARTVTPERWAGVFFTAQTFSQLLLAIALALVILPSFGANGALACLAAVACCGVLPAVLTPSGFAPLVDDPALSGAPPPRGGVALAATLVFVSAGGAVVMYLEPLAHQAHLSAAVARTALWTSLCAQVAGGAVATLLAGRLRYFTVFLVTTAIYLVTWAAMGFDLPSWMFVLANIASGFGALFLAPFLVPFIIAADPSRRAAMQSGAAQLLGGALGPLLASFVVSDHDVRAVLWLGVGLMATGLAVVAGLRFTERR